MAKVPPFFSSPPLKFGKIMLNNMGNISWVEIKWMHIRITTNLRLRNQTGQFNVPRLATEDYAH
jgi:hypothetical protein